MDTIVLKFGGSSLADNIKLNIVANKIIEYKKKNNVVVIVSAQGKTTDKLLNEAKELAKLPDKRELDTLLSTGEQVAASKLAILLQELGYDAISLTGWQAGILTQGEYQSSIIYSINTKRIKQEISSNKIVIITGFQGINELNDITTLGRGGSDTSAVAIAAAIKAKNCYIFSDVDGVYTTDPNKISSAKKLEKLSYEEMLEISGEGAKVLHNRCVEIGEKFNIPITTKSTFNNKKGTIIQDVIEDAKVKSIVKNDDIFLINMKYELYSKELFNKIYYTLLANNILLNDLKVNSAHSLDIDFTIKAKDLLQFEQIIEKEFQVFNVSFTNITRLAVVGYGINNNTDILRTTLEIINTNNYEIYSLSISETKIVIMFAQKLSNSILEQLHTTLIK